MEYIKDFLDVASYEAYIQSEEAVFPNVSLTESDNIIHYNRGVPVPPVPPIDYSTIPLTIEITSGSGNLTIREGTYDEANMYYKLNDNSWVKVNSAETIAVETNDKIQIKGEYNYGVASSDYHLIYESSQSLRYIMYGNFMSIFYGDDFLNYTDYPDLYGDGYNNLFKHLSGLTSVENLVLAATSLTGGVANYNSMFAGCPNLTTAPAILPATTLGYGCYYCMFSACTSLTTAPQLPATTLAENCYQNMFIGCTSLTTAPVISATTLAQNCCGAMFKGCTALTSVVLPSPTLAQYCYSEMFSGCTSLNDVTCLATNISAGHCTEFWLSGVAQTGTFTKAASMSNWGSGVNGIPNGWTVEDAS